MEQSFSFGSTSGSVFAFWFFGVISAFIGFAVYTLATNAKYRRGILRPVGVLPRWQGLVVSAGLSFLLQGLVYLTALDGFYRLTIQPDGIRLDYILPQRALWIKRGEIAEVRTTPSYKSQWRVHMYTPTGEEFISAHASYPQVRKAAERLVSYLKEERNTMQEAVPTP